jgi:hypothetical protein
MKKEIFVHFAFLISLLILISIARGYLSISYWSLWLGGIIGTILPDLDHFLYVYFLRPQELTSQRVGLMMGKRDIWGSLEMLAETRSERTKLIFHTATFQIIFLILTFFVLSSSGSIFGRGLVLAFSLHLLVDQAVDITSGGTGNWFKNFPISLAGKEKAYLIVNIFLLLLFSFFL